MEAPTIRIWTASPGRNQHTNSKCTLSGEWWSAEQHIHSMGVWSTLWLTIVRGA
jgi:hypothetical protein